MKRIIENRIERVRKTLRKEGVDAFMVLVEENRRYLSGFTGEDTQFDESAGALFITGSRLLLATDSRYDLQAGAEAPLYEVFTYRNGLAKELPEILRNLDTRRLGFESIRLTCLQHEKMVESLKESGLSVRLKPLENVVEALRIIKSENEIEALRRALHLAESVFIGIRPTLLPGMTEKEVAWAMEKGMREGGAEALSFPVIVASGPTAALPHAIPGDRPLGSGEPVLFDWGARLDGFCSDISRTVLMGTPDETFKKVFDTVFEAQRRAIAAIRPGISGKAVDRVARAHIESAGFGGKFGHGLGHGTGLAIHEAPRLSPVKDDTLEPGMVFTVEPGIYLPEWGGVRLENMVVLRDDGPEVLNRTRPDENHLMG